MKENLTEATINVELIKKGMAGYINDVLRGSGSNSCTIQAGKIEINNVVAAKPSNRHSMNGIQPYADLELILANGNSVFVSIRQRAENPFSKKLGRFAIPALEKGIWSIEKLYPNIRRDFISSLLKYYTEKGYTHKSVINQAYGVIADKQMKEKILIGHVDLGGKSDFIFAIERPSFTYKGIKLPKASFGFKKGRFTITFGKTTAFSAQEILAQNEIYMWIPDSQYHTLYLATDMVDKANMPIIIGPPAAKKAPFLSKIKIGLNRAKKGSDVFPIENNERFFKLELKPKHDLEKQEHDVNTNQPEKHDHDISNSYTRNRTIDDVSTLIHKSDIDYDDRDALIKHIIELAKTGLRHAYQINLDDTENEGVEESLVSHLEHEDDRTLQRYAAEKPHRLAAEFQRKYFE